MTCARARIAVRLQVPRPKFLETHIASDTGPRQLLLEAACMKRAFGAVALLLCISGCAQSAQSTSTSSAAPSPQATNPIDFPLYSGSTVLAARDWRGANGSGASVSGREVVAESSASLDTLEGWLHDVSANPPAGYTVAVSGSGADAAHRHAQAMGLQFQVF